MIGDRNAKVGQDETVMNFEFIPKNGITRRLTNRIDRNKRPRLAGV